MSVLTSSRMVGLTLATSLTTVALLWVREWLSRSTAPLADVPDKTTSSCRVDHRLTEKELSNVVDAFASSTDMIWTFQGNYSKPVHDKQKFRELLTYMLSFMIRLAENYGSIITYRLENDGEDDFGGAICLIPVTTSTRLFAWILCMAISVVGAPPLQDEKAIKKRLDAWERTMHHHHEVMKEYCPGRPHWYIGNLAATPAVQGKGVGTALVKQAKALAKREEQCLFLECTDKNVPYYRKHGFIVARRYFLTPKGVEDADEKRDPFARFPMNAMIYDPLMEAKEAS